MCLNSRPIEVIHASVMNELAIVDAVMSCDTISDTIHRIIHKDKHSTLVSTVVSYVKFSPTSLNRSTISWALGGEIPKFLAIAC